MPKIHSYAIALAASLLLVLTASDQAMGQARQPVDEIVALVEDDIILRSELDQSIAGIVQQIRARGQSLPPRDVLEQQVLERLILTRLEIQRAQATGIRAADSDIDQTMRQVAAQNNMNLSQLRTALEAEGFDFEEFRADIRNEILTERLYRRVVDSMESISSAEIDMLLASDAFGGDEVFLHQILISVAEGAAPGQVQQARQQAESIRQQIADGLDFVSAAITYSQAPDALDGGQLGWRHLNSLPQLLIDEIDPLPVGQVSQPVRFPGGFLLIKVSDRRERSEVLVREFRARHLMVEESELVSPQQARERIERFHDMLRDGADFAELAREHSDDESSANIGGLLNWFPEGNYGPQIQAVLDSLDAGEMSLPFQTAGAWHILKLEDTRQADRTEEVLREEAREILRSQKADEEIARFRRQLRGESFVEVRL